MKKKHIGRWQRSSIAVLSILLAASSGLTAGAVSYKSLICTAIGGDMYKTVDKQHSEPVVPYPTNGESLEEWKQEADALVEEVESEGIVLLKNEGEVLPLAKGNKLSLFSRSSVDLVLGGTGAGGIDPSKTVDLKTALEEDGEFEVNNTLWDFYKTYDGKDGYIRSNGSYSGALPEDIFTAEVPQSEYTDAVKASYADYNDAAVVVISRVGGEGSDMPAGDFGDGTKYLALQEQEKELLRSIQESGQFKKTIVLLNSSNALELGWMDQKEYGVDACLWIGGVGQSGARAVADVLAGKINPSGHLVDTYAADSFSSPAMQNFGDYTYSNADEIEKQIGGQNSGTKYVVYREGIYVGYRYYETRYADSVIDLEGTNATSSAGAYVGETWNYGDEVCYPFGYGLSYGTKDGQPFEQKLVSAKVTEDGFEAEVKVTNTGDMAGKSTVQLYAQQPYKTGGIEKSAVQLVGFEKTDVLEPGKSETVTITADKEDYSSYDYKEEKTYVLDSGDYYFAIGNNVHDALNNILAAQGMTTQNGMDEEGDASAVYQWNQAEKELLSTAVSGAEITNQFDNASLEYYGQETGYLTRSDWNTFPESYTDLAATNEMMADIDAQGSYESSGLVDKDITTGKDNEIAFASMNGADFNDERWDTLLDELTVEDMVKMVTGSGLSTIPSVSYPSMFMKDGPQGNNMRSYVEDGTSATGFCGEVVRASTFNKDLIRRAGDAMGEDWLRTDTEGAYTPAVNIHRTPYAGRNFEYYSEDGFLAGELANEEVIGMQEKGAICYIKHFVMNDQETNRIGICTFSNEQAIREIYLKAFEKAFVEGKTKGTMGSFNRIGCTWSGAHSGLMTGIVRGEWGSTAIVDTDIAINTSLQNVEAGLTAGTNMWATSGSSFYDYTIEKAKKDGDLLAKLRESCHIILYNVANSSGVNNLSPTAQIKNAMPYWQKILTAIIAVLAALDVLAAVSLIYTSRKKVSEEGV